MQRCHSAFVGSHLVVPSALDNLLASKPEPLTLPRPRNIHGAPSSPSIPFDVFPPAAAAAVPHPEALHLGFHVSEGVLDEGQQAVRGLEQEPSAAELQPSLLSRSASEPPRPRPCPYPCPPALDIAGVIIVCVAAPAAAGSPVAAGSGAQRRVEVGTVVLLRSKLSR